MTGETAQLPVVRWLLPALGTLLAWGIWAFIPKLALQSMEPNSILFYAALGDLFVAIPVFVWMHLKMRVRLQRDKKATAITAAASALTVAAMLAYFYALAHGPVTVIATMVALYPVITVILARIFLQERINRRQILAVAMAVVAIILLAG